MTLAVILFAIAVVLGGLWFFLPASRSLIVGTTAAILSFLAASLTQLGDLLRGLV